MVNKASDAKCYVDNEEKILFSTILLYEVDFSTIVLHIPFPLQDAEAVRGWHSDQTYRRRGLQIQTLPESPGPVSENRGIETEGLLRSISALHWRWGIVMKFSSWMEDVSLILNRNC